MARSFTVSLAELFTANSAVPFAVGADALKRTIPGGLTAHHEITMVIKITTDVSYNALFERFLLFKPS